MKIDLSKLITADAKFEQAIESKKQEIDRARDEALLAGFEFDGNVFDSDQKSIQRIASIATLTLLDPDYTTEYITKDNRTIELDAQAIAGLGKAAAEHEASLVFKARQLKDQALAAKTQAELDKVVWE